MFKQMTRVLLAPPLLGIFTACASGAGQETTTATAESMPSPATEDGPIGPPLVWLMIDNEEILATTLGYSNAFIAVELIDLPSDIPPISSLSRPAFRYASASIPGGSRCSRQGCNPGLPLTIRFSTR